MKHTPVRSRAPSGEVWLGDVPSNWEVCAIAYRYEIALGKMLDEKRVTGEALGPYLRNVDVQWGRISTDDLPTMDFIGGDVERYALRVGDLLVCEGGEVGRSAIWTAPIEPCFYQKALHRLRARDQSRDLPQFMQYCLRAAADRGVFAGAEGKSTIAHLTAEALRRYRFPFPPPHEQNAIAAFLDRETAKIDALVEEQRRLIELLKEKRQAIISHAVTKGLDPNARMKPSGVEWLGDVPEDWEIMPLKRLAGIRYGIGEPPGYVEEGVPLVRATNVDAGQIRGEGMVFVNPSDISAGRILWLKEGDIIVVRSGAYTGDSAIVPAELLPAIAGFDMVVRAKKIVPAFLQLALLSPYLKQGQIDLERVRAAQPHLNAEELGGCRLAVPPFDEQAKIVSATLPVLRDIDRLVDEAERGVVLLLERRFALISAVVTGKISVFEHAKPVHAASEVRTLVATDAIERLSAKRTFGRVKLQKVIYLAEAHADIAEIGGSYLRAAAGPLDRNLIDAIEADLARTGHVSIEQPDGAGSQVTYKVRGRKGLHREDLLSALGGRAARLDHVIDAVADLETKGAEAVATLYAVWNDFLLDGKEPTDDDIVSGVLDDWHPVKRNKFQSNDLHTWLGWMRRHSLVPSGNGPRTTTGRLFP